MTQGHLHRDSRSVSALDPGANKFGAGGYESGGHSFIPSSQDDFSEILTLSFAVWDSLLTRVEHRFDDIPKGATGGAFQVQNEVTAEAVNPS